MKVIVVYVMKNDCCCPYLGTVCFNVQFPVGKRDDISFIHGLVFTKNVALKKMKTHIPNPCILLLRGSIEYQRVEHKFCSLEPQILQVIYY